jgi:benzodiazapine receptor
MSKKLKFINIVALLAVIFVNFLANGLPINNQSTGEISAKYPVLFTPAGYVFSIWGLIYLLLIGFVIYQALPGQAKNTTVLNTSYFFLLSSIFNILWIFAWHFDFIGLSLIIMLALLFTLIAIYLRVNTRSNNLSFADKLFVKLPFSVYLGWISVATIANFSVFLYNINWNGWGIGDVTWTVIVILIGTILAIINILTRYDIAFTLVFVWAFVGIGVRHGSDLLQITAVALLGSAMIIFMLLWTKFSRKTSINTQFK